MIDGAVRKNRELAARVLALVLERPEVAQLSAAFHFTML
jgi:hypothetical protein